MADDCTPLSIEIYEYLRQVRSEGVAKTFDDAVKIMMSDIPGLDRQSIHEAVVAVESENVRIAQEQRANRENVTADELAKSGVTDAAKVEKVMKKKTPKTAGDKAALQKAKEEAKANTKTTKAKAKENLGRASEIEEQADAIAKGGKAKASRKAVKLSTAANRAALEVVEKNPKIQRDELVAAVYEILVEEYPDITLRSTRDAISSYGVFHELSKKESHVALRGLKQEMLKESQLEDWKVPIIPPATGREHALMSGEARRLQAEVNEAKKASGLAGADSEENLKTALQAIKRRIENQIDDYTKQLVDLVRTIKEKNSVVMDENSDAVKEIRAKEAKRDMLKIIFDETFGRNDEKIRIAAKEAKIAAIEKQLAEHKRTKKKDKPEEKISAYEAELNAKLKTARKELADMESQFREEEKFAELEAKIERIQSIDGRIAQAGMDALSKDKAAATAAKELMKTLKKERAAELAGNKKTPSISDALKEARKKTSEARREVGIHRTIQELTRRIEEHDIHPPTPKEEAVMRRVDKYALERDRLRSKVRRIQNSLLPRSFTDKYIFGATRLLGSIITTLELSPTLIQGGFYVIGHPINAVDVVRKGLKTMSEIGDLRAQREYDARPNLWMYQRGGLARTEADSLSKREETNLSELLEDPPKWLTNIPVFGQAVKGVSKAHNMTSRYYRNLLNTIRADLFDQLVAALPQDRNPTNAELKAIAYLCNAATGRGNFGKHEAVAGFLANLAFAPRHYLSRIQMVTFSPLRNAPTKALKIAIAKEYARYLVGLGSLIMVGQLFMGGDEDDKDFWERFRKMTFDPRSSDFGKIRDGERRIDTMSGFQQFIVTGTRVGFAAVNFFQEPVTGYHINEYKRSDGLTVPISGPNLPYGGRDAKDVAVDFARGKASPAMSIAADVITGKNFMGETVTAIDVLKRYAGPITWRSILGTQIWQDEVGPYSKAVGVALSLFGANVNDYESRDVNAAASRLAGEQRLLSTKRSNLRKEKKTLSPEDERRYKRLSYFMSGGPDGKGYTELSALIKASKAKGDLAAAKRYGERIDAIAAKFASQQEAEQ